MLNFVDKTKHVRHPFQDVGEHRKSEVWKHFLNDKAQQRVKCKLCSVTLKADGSSTKSLISHLKSKHRIQVKRCNEIAAEDDQPILKSSHIESYFKSKKESISKVIAQLVSVNGLTFNQIANSSLISGAFKADGYSIPLSQSNSRNFNITMGLFCAKSLFHQYPKTPSFPGVFHSGTRNPGFKILSRIGNTTCKQSELEIFLSRINCTISDITSDF